MASVDERMRILKMVEDGKISAEDGARLLAALTQSARDAQRGGRGGSSPPGVAAADDRFLRIRVTELTTGRPKVNIRLPMSMVNVALKIGARFSTDIEGLDPARIVEAIQANASGPVIDMTDQKDNERVEILVE